MFFETRSLSTATFCYGCRTCVLQLLGLFRLTVLIYLFSLLILICINDLKALKFIYEKNDMKVTTTGPLLVHQKQFTVFTNICYTIMCNIGINMYVKTTNYFHTKPEFLGEMHVSRIKGVNPKCHIKRPIGCCSDRLASMKGVHLRIIFFDEYL